MTDFCSNLAYNKLDKSRYFGKMQAYYLYVFARENRPLTHREASELVDETYHTKVPARNGRIAELTDMGMLKKVDTITDEETGQTVNRWIWTGHTEPLPKRKEFVECPHCQGVGGQMKDVYYNPATDNKQGSFTY